MANEVQASFQTGRNVHYLLRNHTSGFIWSLSGGTGGAFESFVSGNYANYGIGMTEQGVTGFYQGNLPTALGAGFFGLTAKERLGASPAQTDPTVAVGDLNWNGTNVLPLSDLATSGQIGQVAPIRLARGIAVSGFPFKLVSAADHITPFTSGVVSGQISRDGGSFGALQSGTFTEIGLGFFRTNLTSGDLLATTCAMVFTANGISGGTSDPLAFTLVLQRTSGQ